MLAPNEYIRAYYIRKYELEHLVRRSRQITSVILDIPSRVVALVSAD